MEFKIKCADFWKTFDVLYKVHIPTSYKLEHTSDTINKYPDVLHNLGLYLLDVINERPDPYSSWYYRFKVINNKRWVYTKIKYGI